MSQIVFPATNFKLSPETEKLRKAIQDRIDKLAAPQAKLEEKLERLRQLPAGEVSGILDQSNKLKKEKAQYLEEELAIRNDLFSFFDLAQKDRKTAVNESFQALQNEQERIRKALIALGYSEASEGKCTPPSLQPVMILNHPSVRQLRNANRALVDSSFEPHAQNQARCDQITAQLESIRRAALA